MGRCCIAWDFLRAAPCTDYRACGSGIRCNGDSGPACRFALLNGSLLGLQLSCSRLHSHAKTYNLYGRTCTTGLAAASAAGAMLICWSLKLGRASCSIARQ